MQRTRLQKEVSYYHKEIQENEARLADMKADTSKFDAYDIKRFQQVLDESYMMIPDSQRRYQQSLQDLKNYILELKDNVTDDDSTSSEAKKDALAGEWYGFSVAPGTTGARTYERSRTCPYDSTNEPGRFDRGRSLLKKAKQR
jgi:tubulin-specific chaperone A